MYDFLMHEPSPVVRQRHVGFDRGVAAGRVGADLKGERE